MKNEILVFFLLLICFIQMEMNAQTSFGVKGGVNGSWMGIENEKVKFGIHTGAFGCTTDHQQLNYRIVKI